MFGLGKNDSSKLLGLKKGGWEPPNNEEVSWNTQHVEELAASANL
jgi:hypothetical protein